MKQHIFLILFLFLSIGLYAQGKIHGLTVIADFNDFQYKASDATIDSLLNQKSGYNKAGNVGSLNEFFKDQTDGKYDVTHTVVRIRFHKNRSYFKNSSGRNPDTNEPWDWGQAFADSVILKVKEKYPDGIPGLTRYKELSNNGIGSWLVLVPFGYSAYGVKSVIPFKSGDSYIPMNHIGLCDIGQGTETSHMTRILAHESSHAIFRFPDIGNQAGDDLSKKGNAGSFCIMGWNAGSENSPIDYCAPLLLTLKTAEVVDISADDKKKISIRSNARDTLYRFVNPKNSKEYFVIQSLNHSKWYPSYNVAGHPMDIGLAIWHVVEDSNAPMHPWFRLVAADGVDLMNDRSTKPPVATGNDNRVLLGKNVKSVNGKINPMLRWRDGTVPSLKISDISVPGAIMNFNVGY
ncbi:hypothetical protein KO02_21735 [Sphingobacterium sp. ML3W]|uniref:hypothetical protein n=1 Tax=Sphingobacterium sp. ML3W TaxID=1538644 RepID=UPI0004F642D1|nr:hypothetical protein [Sphingobacterium sp. ML3W]AIM39020.1 hypothetical protein KO02_21735 [Sphingobacterium sp. ML3W]